MRRLRTTRTFSDGRLSNQFGLGIPRPLNADDSEGSQCSKFVVVVGSERCKTKMNESTPGRCNCLNDIVESRIFKTSQNVPLFYESAALTS